MAGECYRNIFVFYFDIKDSIYFLCSFSSVCSMQHAGYMRAEHLCLSMQDVTKHRDWSLSPTGINWVSDGVSIDFIEYMCYKSVHFYGSLERTVIVDS